MNKNVVTLSIGTQSCKKCQKRARKGKKGLCKKCSQFRFTRKVKSKKRTKSMRIRKKSIQLNK